MRLQSFVKQSSQQIEQRGGALVVKQGFDANEKESRINNKRRALCRETWLHQRPGPSLRLGSAGLNSVTSVVMGRSSQDAAAAPAPVVPQCNIHSIRRSSQGRIPA